MLCSMASFGLLSRDGFAKEGSRHCLIRLTTKADTAGAFDLVTFPAELG